MSSEPFHFDGAVVQRIAIMHMDACWASMAAEYGDMAEEPPPWPVDLPTTGPMAPFCGCEDCVVRETLYAGFVAAGVMKP